MPTTEELINGFIASADANLTMWQNKKAEIDTSLQTAITALDTAKANIVADEAATAQSRSNVETDETAVANSKANVDANAAAVAAVVADVRNGISANADLYRKEAGFVRLSPNQLGVQSLGVTELPDNWRRSSSAIQFNQLFKMASGNPDTQADQAEVDQFFSDLGTGKPGWFRRDYFVIRVSWTNALNERFFNYIFDRGTPITCGAYIRRISGSLAGTWGRVSDAELPLNTWKLTGGSTDRNFNYSDRYITLNSADGVVDIFMPAIVSGYFDHTVDPWRWWLTPYLSGNVED